jgi:hypothetical protein
MSMFQPRYALLAVLGLLTGCIVSPAQLAQWIAEGPEGSGPSVADLAPNPIPDPNDPAFDSPAVADAPIRVRLSNPTERDADCRVTMQIIGREVHFSLRRILAATSSLVIGPERADIVRIEVTFLGEPPAAMEPQVLRIGRDFAPGDIIDFVLALPVEPPTIAIEGLDANVVVNPGDMVTFDIVTENASEAARIGAFADPDNDPENGNEISILDDAPAADRTSVAWDTANVPPGTYAVYAELRDGDELVRFGPAPGRVIVESLPPPQGACCFADGRCELLTADECSLGGGEYQGDSTGCDPNPCPPPLGACCFPDGVCELLTADECSVSGGDYQGDLTSCDPNPCPQPTGACCYPDGTCEVLAEAECIDGEWLGPDTTCDMCPCVVICPMDAFIEDEPCGADTNGGCNMPAPAFEPLSCGETVCGTIWAENEARDTDWYEVTVAEDTELTFTVEAEFGGLGVIIGFLEQFEPGIPGCENLTGGLFPSASGAECEVISVTQCVPPGTYYLFVSALDYFGLPCDSNNDYVATLTCAPCVIPRGACCLLDFVCDVLTPEQCAAAGGDYQGDGVSCDPNPCLPPEGACCFPDDMCKLMTEAGCTVSQGEYQGDFTTCDPNPCRDPGDTCDNPLAVVVPGGLPYSDTNTTCGRGNDYTDTCLSPYDTGEDIVYELIVTATTTIQIAVDPQGVPDTGVALAWDCPPAECIEAASDPIGKPYSTDCYLLEPGTYYVMVDSTSECIGSFVLTIVQCE